jgi:preprotein translocase subunit SecE
MLKDYLPIIIWTAIIAVVFGVLWATGNLGRLRNYVLETREELRKCTWPSVDELKGSTVVVVISIILVGVFTIAIDFLLSGIINWMAKI